MPLCGDDAAESMEDTLRRLRAEGLQRDAAPYTRRGEPGVADVHINVYHIIAARWNRRCAARGVGVFHSGVEVYGREWSFGAPVSPTTITGVFDTAPMQAMNDLYQRIYLGQTPLTEEQVTTTIRRVEIEWPAVEYAVLAKNCNHFCEYFCSLLRTERPFVFPVWVNRLPRSVNVVVPQRLAAWAVARFADEAPPTADSAPAAPAPAPGRAPAPGTAPKEKEGERDANGSKPGPAKDNPPRPGQEAKPKAAAKPAAKPAGKPAAKPAAKAAAKPAAKRQPRHLERGRRKAVHADADDDDIELTSVAPRPGTAPPPLDDDDDGPSLDSPQESPPRAKYEVSPVEATPPPASPPPVMSPLMPRTPLRVPSVARPLLSASPVVPASRRTLPLVEPGPPHPTGTVLAIEADTRSVEAPSPPGQLVSPAAQPVLVPLGKGRRDEKVKVTFADGRRAGPEEDLSDVELAPAHDAHEADNTLGAAQAVDAIDADDGSETAADATATVLPTATPAADDATIDESSHKNSTAPAGCGTATGVALMTAAELSAPTGLTGLGLTTLPTAGPSGMELSDTSETFDHDLSSDAAAAYGPAEGAAAAFSPAEGDEGSAMTSLPKAKAAFVAAAAAAAASAAATA